MKTVVIFGGSGFVGRHIIRRIAQNGYKIIIPYQHKLNEADFRLLGITGQIILFKYQSLKTPLLLNLLKKTDVVINLKTMWDEKKIKYEKGIFKFNIKLISILNTYNFKCQFIYFSGVGVNDDINSKRSQAIYKSETYIQENIDNSIIIRPGIIIGGGDKFLQGLLPLFKYSPFIPLFGSGNSKFQPVFIDDISLAVNKIIKDNFFGNHVFEFVGLEVFTYMEFYDLIRSCCGSRKFFIKIPFLIIKVIIFILEKTPFSPIKSEQLKLFKRDNISLGIHKKLSDLNIIPQDLREIVRKIIKKSI